MTTPADRYVIESELARGGLGRVLKAYDRVLERHVALKELLPGRKAAEQRFVREAQITGRLEHPSIVPVYDAGEWPGGRRFYAMKLVAGRTLLDVIDATSTLAGRLALLPALIAVAEAVAYAHSRGVIHRDLKPANVILGDFGETIVVDWGLAKLLGEAHDDAPHDGAAAAPADEQTYAATLHGTVLGTPGYMAPEQARGDKVDERADVYALGALIYHVLGGVSPAGAAGVAAQQSTLPGGQWSEPTLQAGKLQEAQRGSARARRGPLRPLEELEPGAPDELGAVVRKAMADDPAERYPNARELALDLERYQAGQLLSAHRYTTWSRVIRWLARHRFVVGVVGAAAVVVAVVTAVAMIRIVRARGVAEAERRLAEQRRDEADRERASAQVARQQAETRTNELTLVQARALLDHDPTASLAWLKQYPLDAPRWDEAHAIADEAMSHGVARHEWRAGDHANAAACSPDGKWMAVGSGDGSVYLFGRDGAAHRLVGHTALVMGVAFSPDGRQLASVAEDHVLRLWEDLGPGAHARVLGKEDVELSYVVFAPDGQHLAASAGPKVLVWDVAGGAPRVLTGHTGDVWDLAFAPDGLLVSASNDRTLRTWNLATGATRVLQTATLFPHIVRFARDGTLFSAVDDTLYRWDLATGTSAVVVKVANATFFSLAVAPDGTIALGATDGIVHLLGPTGELRSLHGHIGYITGLAFAGDAGLLSVAKDGGVRAWDLAPVEGRVLLRGPHRVVAAQPDGAAHIVTIEEHGELALFVPGGAAPTILAEARRVGGQARASFSPRGDELAVATKTMLLVRDLATGRSRELPFVMPLRLQFFADGPRLLVHQSQRLSVVDLGTGVVVCSTSADDIPAAALSPDGREVAFVTQEDVGHVDLLTLATCATQRLYSAGSEMTNSLAFSPDGKRVASTHEGRFVMMYDRTSGASHKLVGHTMEVGRVAWSPDGQLLASEAADHTVRIWSAANGALLHVVLHPAPTIALAFTPDGHVVVVDRTTIVTIDAPTGVAHVRQVHDGAVTRAALAADGKTVTVATETGMVRVWPVDTSSAPPTEPAALAAWLRATTDATASY